MDCDVCGSEMRLGKALNSSTLEQGLCGPAVRANHETIGFIDVAKCTGCGRSLNEQELRDRGMDLRSLEEK